MLLSEETAAKGPRPWAGEALSCISVYRKRERSAGLAGDVHYPCRLQGNHRHQGKRNNHCHVCDWNQPACPPPTLKLQPRSLQHVLCVPTWPHQAACSRWPWQRGCRCSAQLSFPALFSAYGQQVWFGLVHQTPWLFLPLYPTAGGHLLVGFSPSVSKKSHDGSFSVPSNLMGLRWIKDGSYQGFMSGN